jgi:xylose dehydrogenase (NAD/NADP)
MIRWGILSTARISKAVMLDSGANVVAVASRDADRARAYADEHGIERALGSYQALIDDPEIDAIYNPLPNSMHLPWSVRALEAGKHVLCEKPLDRRPIEVEAAFDVAARVDRVLVEAFFWRYHPQVEKVLELLADGAIGRVRQVRSSFSFPLDDPTDIRVQAELDGGALMDLGCYCVHATRSLLGAEPLRVYAEQVQTGPGGVDAVTSAVLRFPDDVTATFDCSFELQDTWDLEITGELGSIAFSNPWHGTDPTLAVRQLDDVELIEFDPIDAYAIQIASVEASIRGEASPLLGRDDALGQVRTIEALYASAAAGAPVTLG